MIIKEINADEGRETELMMAKLQPFDGETIYEKKEDGSEFLGYELTSFKIRERLDRIDGILTIVFRVGTTITKHIRRPVSEKIESVTEGEISSPRNDDSNIHRELQFPLRYLSGMWCDEKMYDHYLDEARSIKEARDYYYGPKNDERKY